MSRRVAQRCGTAGRSATMAINDTVQQLRAAGVPVLDLGGGTPHFDTPRHISAAATAALQAGHTRYSPSRGIPELLRAIAAKLGSENGITADPSTQIIVTPSAKHALFMTFMTILDPDDEILIPTPSWVSYQSMARLAGARPVPVRLSGGDGFRLTAPALRAAITANSRAIMINSPNNPTGRVLTPAEADAVAEVANERDLLIVTDEIYEKILPGGGTHLSLGARPDCADRTFTINGFSKSHAMPGWRLGWVAGPADCMAAMLSVQQHTVACAGSFIQHGGVAALTGSQEPLRAMYAEYAEHARRAVARLDAMPGVTCRMPEGTFYAFADITGTGTADDVDFADRLLRECSVAVTPGSAFGPGGEGHIRLSLASSADVIDAALDRIGAQIEKH